MKIASWNVNSLKVRLPHLLDWLAEQQPDALCLQETKLEDHNFPRAEIEAAGYQVAFSGQKTYNGVALLARQPIGNVVCGNPHFPDEQRRLIAGTIGDTRVVCAYMPNGQAVGSDKYDYKLRWLDALASWLAEEVASYPNLALCGDYNIAPDDRDVHDPRLWEGQVHVSEAERAAFRALLGLGFAFCGVLLSALTGSGVWDGAGSVAAFIHDKSSSPVRMVYRYLSTKSLSSRKSIVLR